MKKEEIIGVSQYLDKLNSSLREEKSKIIGEVFEVREYPGRSYLYFGLKDKKDGSTLQCFMWKTDFRLSGISLKDGIEVVITAYPNVYKPSGKLSMQVELVELIGEGALQIAYEKLKKKLETEGLFSDDRKRSIPKYPHRVGVITSKSGAVINDFLTNIGKYGFEIIFVDSKVEGQDAIKDLLSAVETLKKKDLDVLVLMRGGGSLESFQAFNNEVLVKAIANFPVPTLTGIGHDKDAPLVSLVSDRTVSTPTAVANLLNLGWNEAKHLLQLSEEKILTQFESSFREWKFMMEAKDLLKEFSNFISKISDFLSQSQKTLNSLNPERQISLGYSIVRWKGKVVRKKSEVKKGSELDIMVSDGIIQSEVI